MDYRETMAALEAAGTAQNRKVYARHGVKEPMLGVSYAELGKLQRKIKRDHALATQLWRSGVHDARVLASMIADAAAMSAADCDAWVASLDNYVLTDAVAKLVAQTPHARAKAEQWRKAKDEPTATAGWSLVAILAAPEHGSDDAWLAALIPVIERGIRGAHNRVRQAMNIALIAIGTRSDALEQAAIATAERIGPVEVDHGETGCKTPDAASYIVKARAHARAKAGRQRAGANPARLVPRAKPARKKTTIG